MLLELWEKVLGFLGVILGLCLAQIFFPYFFLPRGHEPDLFDVCFFQYIHHFEGIGDVLQSYYAYSVIFVTREFNVFGGDWEISSVKSILTDSVYFIWSEYLRGEFFSSQFYQFDMEIAW